MIVRNDAEISNHSGSPGWVLVDISGLFAQLWIFFERSFFNDIPKDGLHLWLELGSCLFCCLQRWSLHVWAMESVLILVYSESCGDRFGSRREKMK